MNPGTGQPHIICPMEKYIRTIRNPTDAIRRFFSTGVSLSFSMSSPAKACVGCAFAAPSPFFDAPYPASLTALMISCSLAVPSTPIELVSRLTEQDVTPGTFETAFSTLLLQAAQLIPVTIYCSIVVCSLLSLLFFLFLYSKLRKCFPSRLYIYKLYLPHQLL